MATKTITFETFEAEFIHGPWGYLPVDIGITETHEGEFLPSILLEMIVRYRLPDGKILFLTVTFDNQEQLDRILAWVRKAAEQLKSEIIRVADDPLGMDVIKWP